MSMERSAGPLPLSYAGYEFLLTTSLLFSVVTAVRWLRDPASGAYISALRPALAVLAGLTAVLLVALILSPLGRRSGGHLNPAVTIGLWLMDVSPVPVSSRMWPPSWRAQRPGWRSARLRWRWR